MSNTNTGVMFETAFRKANHFILHILYLTHTCTSKEDCKVLQREFQLNRFEETIALPDDVDTERISAKMENGILHIALPKMDEKQRLRSAKMIAIE